MVLRGKHKEYKRKWREVAMGCVKRLAAGMCGKACLSGRQIKRKRGCAPSLRSLPTQLFDIDFQRLVLQRPSFPEP